MSAFQIEGPSSEAPFTVLDVPGLAAWWDASDAATITDAGGGAVSAWADKSGSGYNLTAAGTARPTTGTRTINGLNVLDFDGGSDVLSLTGFNQPAICVYAVIEPDTISGTDLIVHSGTTGSDDWSFYLNAGTPTFFGGGSSATCTALSAGTLVLMRSWAIGVGSNGWAFKMRANGNQGAAALSGVKIYTGLQVGNTDTGSNFYDGKIGEVVLVAQGLSAGTDSDLRSYLANKWAVTA